MYATTTGLELTVYPPGLYARRQNMLWITANWHKLYSWAMYW